MKKILVIGCCGAGKSTLAKKLSVKTGLPIIHLDKVYWNPNWEETPKVEWERKIKLLVSQSTYIMDGNYSGSLHLRLPSADKIIFLDYPTRICLWRVIKRTWNNLGNTRQDMASGCPERFDIKFLHYVLVFNLVTRKRLYRILKARKEFSQLIVLKNDAAVNTYLAQI